MTRVTVALRSAVRVALRALRSATLVSLCSDLRKIAEGPEYYVRNIELQYSHEHIGRVGAGAQCGRPGETRI